MGKNVNSDYRDVYFFEWPPAKELSLVQSSRVNANGQEEGIVFVPCDLASVVLVREFMQNKAYSRKLSEQETYEISLLADELVSNGIVATYNHDPENKECVILRFSITEDHVILSVLDYGGGFNLDEIQDHIPKGDNLEEFLENLKVYRSNSAGTIPVAGTLREHLRFGRGLKIVTGISDAMVIVLHTKDGKLSRVKTDDTLGAVVSVRYNLKEKKAA